MIPHFIGARLDPITGQNISNHCWNGFHEDHEYHLDAKCHDAGCGCWCHNGGPGLLEELTTHE